MKKVEVKNFKLYTTAVISIEWKQELLNVNLDLAMMSGFQGIKFPWKPTLSGSIEYHGPPRSGRLSFRSPRLIPEF